MSEIGKKDKVTFELTYRQRVDFGKALKYNSMNIAYTREQIYRNKLIESYLNQQGDKLSMTLSDFINCFRILLENYSRLSEKEEE